MLVYLQYWWCSRTQPLGSEDGRILIPAKKPWEISESLTTSFSSSAKFGLQNVPHRVAVSLKENIYAVCFIATMNGSIFIDT